MLQNTQLLATYLMDEKSPLAFLLQISCMIWANVCRVWLAMSQLPWNFYLLEQRWTEFHKLFLKTKYMFPQTKGFLSYFPSFLLSSMLSEFHTKRHLNVWLRPQRQLCIANNVLLWPILKYFNRRSRRTIQYQHKGFGMERVLTLQQVCPILLSVMDNKQMFTNENNWNG